MKIRDPEKKRKNGKEKGKSDGKGRWAGEGKGNGRLSRGAHISYANKLRTLLH